MKSIESGTIQARLAERMKTTSPNVNCVIKKQDGVVTQTLDQLPEVFGYDIEIHYVKRAD